MQNMSNLTRKVIQIPSFCMVNRVSKYSSSSLEAPLSENDIISKEFYNRNPRNLERLRVAWKPQGYHLEAVGPKNRQFWHK
jgi:hypothetical protein